MVRVIAHSAGSAPEFKAQLNGLMMEAFGFSFQTWIERGGWTDDYTCYAISEDGRLLSNVSVYRMELLDHGEARTCYQIGAVATRRDCRGRGLSRQIFEHLFARYPEPGTPFLLFPNETVMGYYPRFGFRLAHDQMPVLSRRLGDIPAGMRHIPINDPKVRAAVNRRAVYSQILDCTNAAAINFFHLLGGLSDCIYEIPALKTIFIARQTGSQLTLYDVLPERPITFEELAPYLGFPGVNTLRFGFNPDWLGLKYDLVGYDDSPIFIRGDFSLPERSIFPLLART